MPRGTGTQAVKQFVDGMMNYENFMEFTTYNALFFLVSIFVGNVIDNALNSAFKKMEDLGLINKEANWWILLQIIIQLILISAISYMIRLFVVGTLLTYSTDSTIYDSKAVSIIYAFITFYAQDHLKERLTKINKVMDRPW